MMLHAVPADNRVGKLAAMGLFNTAIAGVDVCVCSGSLWCDWRSRLMRMFPTQSGSHLSDSWAAPLSCAQLRTLVCVCVCVCVYACAVCAACWFTHCARPAAVTVGSLAWVGANSPSEQFLWMGGTRAVWVTLAII